MKRTVFLALALFALMAVGLYAQTEDDFTVKKSADGKSITITKYKGTATAVNIPAKIQNLPVTEIGNRAFYASEITSVTIPNTVTSIKTAFLVCAYLTSVTFQGTIPVKNFDDDAFDQIGDIRDKFYATDKNNGTPGTYTRPDYKSTTWTRGGSATAAPAAARNTKIEFALTKDGKGYSVKDTGSGGDVVIPATYNNLPVTEIAASAFASNTSINSVIIPNSVTQIRIMAFQGCSFLQSVTIGSGVIDIGKNAFSNCIRLNSVTFGGANTRFSDTEFPEGGDLMAKYKAGGAGTYTKTTSGTTWTKK